MRLSLLDRSRTRTHYPEAAALQHSVERAVTAEKRGYHRFWSAEHHAVPGIASGSPAVLLAAIGAHTSHIRLGSGGVMLPHHQPLVVAEQFLMLEALYPGRTDLGVGRTLGFTEPVRQALRQESDDAERFEADVLELQNFIQRQALVTARPVTQRPPEVFLLATGQGITRAPRLGLPVVIGGPVLHSPDLPSILAAYRRDFVASPTSPEPSVMISLDAFVADTEHEAQAFALPEIWAMARSRETGRFEPLESTDAIRSQTWSPRTRRRVEEGLDRVIAGPHDVVHATLEALAERTGAEELLLSTSTYDQQVQDELDADLAELILGR